jgi:hypothetical protein
LKVVILHYIVGNIVSHSKPVGSRAVVFGAETKGAIDLHTLQQSAAREPTLRVTGSLRPEQ